MSPETIERPASVRFSRLMPIPLLVALLAVFAMAAPLGDAEEPLRRVGALLALGGGLQVLHGVRRADSRALRRAVTGGILSILMGLSVLVLPYGTALIAVLAGIFILDGLGYLG